MCFPSALRQLHGRDWDQEWEDIVMEKENLEGFCAKKPWELFSDRGLRWQVLTIVLLNSTQQLNGINAVRRRPRSGWEHHLRTPSTFNGSRFLSAPSLDLFLCKLPVRTIRYPCWENPICDHWNGRLWMHHCADMREYGSCWWYWWWTNTEGLASEGPWRSRGGCFLQGMLIESLGRRVLIMGGYALMSIFCVLFTLTLTFQVIHPQSIQDVLFDLPVSRSRWSLFSYRQPVLSSPTSAWSASLLLSSASV